MLTNARGYKPARCRLPCFEHLNVQDAGYELALRLFEGRATAEDLARPDAVIERLRGQLWSRSTAE